jgi:CHASE3 domain sensor protein
MDPTGEKMTKGIPVRWLTITLLAIAITIAAAWLSISAPRGVGLVNNFSEFLKTLQNEEQRRIGQIILTTTLNSETPREIGALLRWLVVFVSRVIGLCCRCFKIGILPEK